MCAATRRSKRLAKMKPAFKSDGSVTGGNASGLNDGAAAVVLATADALKSSRLKPLARLVTYAHAGCRSEVHGPRPGGCIAAGAQACQTRARRTSTLSNRTRPWRRRPAPSRARSSSTRPRSTPMAPPSRSIIRWALPAQSSRQRRPMSCFSGRSTGESKVASRPQPVELLRFARQKRSPQQGMSLLGGIAGILHHGTPPVDVGLHNGRLWGRRSDLRG